MATLTPAQLAQVAYNAGFRGKDLAVAVAIALAESGGRTDAYNPELAAGTSPGGGSRGLWQIYGTAHPWANNPTMFDAQQNANAAFRVYREAGGSFRPWSTYTNGMAARIASTLKIPNVQTRTRTPAGRSKQTMRQTATMGGTQNHLQGTNMEHLSMSPALTQTTGLGSSAIGYASGEEVATPGVLGGVESFFSIVGSRSLLDWSSIGVGVALVLIGVIVLLIASGAPQMVAGGAVKTAIKAVI